MGLCKGTRGDRLIGYVDRGKTRSEGKGKILRILDTHSAVDKRKAQGPAESGLLVTVRREQRGGGAQPELVKKTKEVLAVKWNQGGKKRVIRLSYMR